MTCHDMEYEFEAPFGKCFVEFEFVEDGGRAFVTKVCQEHTGPTGKKLLFPVTPFQAIQINDYLQDEMVFYAREELAERKAA